MVLLQLKEPLELFVKRKEFLPGSGFPSRRDITKGVESDVKPHSFLPSSEFCLVAEVVMCVFVCLSN